MAQIKIDRCIFTEHSTIGRLWIREIPFCWTLEDVSRSHKIPKITAIPKGTYQLVMSYSNKFWSFLPELLDVPGYTGIRIHAGNRPLDTEGCILVGKYDIDKKDFVFDSRITLSLILPEIETMVKSEKVFIDVLGGYDHTPISA